MLIPLLALATATANPEADALAQAVAARCGDLDQVAELAFTFVAEKGGEEVARRRHVWSPAAGTVAVTRGDQTVTLPFGAPVPPDGDPAWGAVAPGASAEDARAAWGAFINDQYWLMAPCKVTDPGVRTSVEEGALVLTFDGVGLTPGDRYVLSIDPQTRAVTGWRFRLQSGREGAFVWSEPASAAGLQLTTRRESADGAVVIRFEDVTGRRR